MHLSKDAKDFMDHYIMRECKVLSMVNPEGTVSRVIKCRKIEYSNYVIRESWTK